MNPTVDSAGQSFRPRLALGIPGDLLTRLLLVTAHGNGKPIYSTGDYPAFHDNECQFGKTCPSSMVV